MDYRQAERALLLGVLEALPCPVVLLNQAGEMVYVSGKACPVSLETVAWNTLPELRQLRDSGASVSARLELSDDNARSARGFLELHPVRLEDGDLLGALGLFHPEPVWEEERLTALPTVSESMRHVWERLHILAGLGTPALLLGEEGLGVTELARALHESSPRAALDFVVADAAGSVKEFREMAALCEGSLCCESIDTWSAELLTEATRLYVTRQVSAGGKTVPLRARLIATAAPDLPERARAHLFPEELFTRMNIMPLFVPPLRDRPEDILSAAERMAAGFAAAKSKDIQGFGPEAAALLTRQEWRGNLPELQRVVAEAVSACPGGLLRAMDLSALYRPMDKDPGSLRRMRNAYSREHIRSMLDMYGHGVEGKRKAAAELGVSLATLYRILGSKGK